MRKHIAIVLTTAIALSVCGCIETKQDFTLNPDGSGKVLLEAIFAPIDINLSGEEKDPEEQMKDAVRQTLEESRGVAAWKDVAFKRTNDGRISFKGTAYFEDISKLKFKLGGMDIEMGKPVFAKDEKGGLVLELETEEKDKRKEDRKAMPAKLSEDEIADKIKEEKAKYQQAKPMMAAFLSTMKMEMIFRLPGTLGEVTNFKKDERGTLYIAFEGAKLLEIMDALIEDDALWREQVLTGSSFVSDGPSMDFAMNEKLFGEKGPIRATVTGDLKSLFNYETEVAAARKNYAKLLKELDIGVAVPVTAAKGEGFKSLQVGGARLVKFSDHERGVQPLCWSAGYTLALVGELPGAVLDFTGGKLEKAIADNGDDLLPEREWDRKINFPRLSKDKMTVVFEVNLSLPGENVKGLKEISGMLEYVIAEASKEVDLGIADFTAGTKGKELGAVVKSVKESEWEEGKEALTLKLNISTHSIKSVTFYDTQGEKLDAKRTSTWSGEKETTFEHSCNKFPQKGRIVAEVYEELEKYAIPFKVTNVSLLGQPLK